MQEKSLSIAFGESLKEDVVGMVSDFAEIGLDAVMEDGILKEVPIVSTAIALYKIGNSIKERHNLKKLHIFMNEINKGIVNKEKLDEYKQKFQSNDKFRNQEIEYLLVLLDRYISYDKPQMLAKLYLAYLDGKIVLEEFTMYAEVVDRFILSDKSMLLSKSDTVTVHRNIGDESVLRLVGLGLMTEITDTSTFEEDENGGYSLTWGSLTRSHSMDKIYKRTEFGEKLAHILD